MSRFNQPPRGRVHQPPRENLLMMQLKTSQENLFAQNYQLWQATIIVDKPTEGAQGEGRPVEYEFGFTQSLEDPQNLGGCFEKTENSAGKTWAKKWWFCLQFGWRLFLLLRNHGMKLTIFRPAFWGIFVG